MDANKIEALINAVEKRPNIYDKTSAEYSNRNYLNNAWKKIADEVGCMDDEARRRWKKLRDYFQKSHREMTTSKSGSAGGKKKKWYLYDRMLFVLPYIGDRSTTTNVPPVSSDEDDIDDEDMSQASASPFTSAQRADTLTPTPQVFPTLATEETIHQNPPSNPSITLESQSQPLQNPRPRRPKLFPQHRNKHTEFESEMLKAAQRLGNKPVEMDDDEHFFKNLIPKMKMLSTIDKMKCQAEIHMTVLRYLEKASDSHVMQPERIHHTPPPNTSTYPQSPSGPSRPQMSHSPQTNTYVQSPIQYEGYQYSTSQYQKYY